ncbi:hypothetical protein Hsc_0825 [Herbaspirillum seropedicae]|nr:hypothetical protein Hsc_0825 [Herbaspirillum seropedicae]
MGRVTAAPSCARATGYSQRSTRGVAALWAHLPPIHRQAGGGARVGAGLYPVARPQSGPWDYRPPTTRSSLGRLAGEAGSLVVAPPKCMPTVGGRHPSARERSGSLRVRANQPAVAWCSDLREVWKVDSNAAHSSLLCGTPPQ